MNNSVEIIKNFDEILKNFDEIIGRHDDKAVRDRFCPFSAQLLFPYP